MAEIDVSKGKPGKRVSYKFVKRGTVLSYFRRGMKKGSLNKLVGLRIATGKKGAGVKEDLEIVANAAVKSAIECVMNQMPTYTKGAKKGSIKVKTLTKDISSKAIQSCKF